MIEKEIHIMATHIGILNHIGNSVVVNKSPRKAKIKIIRIQHGSGKLNGWELEIRN